MSTLEKELLETYVETFGEESNIMLKSGRCPNDDVELDDSSSCGCTDINNGKLAKIKGKDKYLVNLKERCKGGIVFFIVGSILLTLIGVMAAGATVSAALYATYRGVNYGTCASAINLLNIMDGDAIVASLKAIGTACAGVASRDIISHAVMASATAIFQGCGIAALVLLILAIILIILYIWLYRRRKNSWKHECKKHLCR
ncbi:hypothetical protein PFTANZ_00014 [Plasmodium falciparum Tanzania (2000708)]|uniref:Surface antigen n=1 Tax=Plasmodium falciparum Tanzania (2000708) TaxID=1036725 RepID=A0A024WFE0_PLAFA|nr:hypothetical protein PFTANZ_00014 [Plasmodium falciparum Tanzania (2000708)]